MAYSMISIAMVGVQIDPTKLPKRKVKAYEHDYPESFQFCPQTARQLWNEVDQSLEEISTLHGLETVWTHKPEDGGICILGRKIAETDVGTSEGSAQQTAMNSTYYETIMKDVRKRLVAMGILPARGVFGKEDGLVGFWVLSQHRY